jgi:predicted ATPase/class 3 adenylate cyclase
LACGAGNEAGRKFCGECGSALAVACASCATPNAPGTKFCGECGTALLSATPPPIRASTPGSGPGAPATQAERRLVSVLFADLVGFTTASEGRDAEDTRELLTRYFDLARTTIERYGGTVEKFIGDAVMAVWGAPVAQEDDAERAVRAALDLVEAVPLLDGGLRARAAVSTGEAAVTLGAEGQGMVAGDLVNTASRIQSAAEPGSVLVGDATRRASEAAIAYEDAGTHELKGKAEVVSLWRAGRVVAARRGEGRAVGLEPPFVGRERELRLVKDLFHATADEGRAHLLSVVGVAGIGKSRLAWEFEKYIDGLADQAWWHRGRCLAYGEGVAYWALAEMIRWRARVTEDEPADEALAKLRRVVAEIVSDPDERAFVEPRLQHLLGLTERVAPDREDLFSAWRLFLERMAEQNPLIMVFEDLQWADSALVEFLEYLLDWSRGHPIFVLTLARPEVAERHPGWGAGLRSFTSLALEPLPDDAIDALLRGLVPGLPDAALARIRERADGVPLYAVETVRMLLDRGLLEPEDAGYRLTGELTSLDVPETLQALIAARLDGLEADERRVLQDAAVLGKTFAPRGVAALAGVDEESVRPTLAGLVRKELLALDSDPRSPERGQYGFVQALVQRIAYDTLSRRDRKAKHLAAAAYLHTQAGIDADEIAEVIAAHLLDAHRSEPADPDAPAIKAEASGWLVRAAERAAALAATEEAQRAFETAAALADAPLDRARLFERAGELALAANSLDAAAAHLRTAFALYDEAGATHDRARVAAGIGLTSWASGSIDEALESLEEAFDVLAGDEPDADVATLAAQLGRFQFFAGNKERAAERIERALDIAEALRLPAPLSSALNTKALIVQQHFFEAEALLRQALRVALDHDVIPEALRAYNNLCVHLDLLDRGEEILPTLEEALALARRRGDRFWEVRLAASMCEELRSRGRWDEAVELHATLLDEQLRHDALLAGAAGGSARIAIERGMPDRAHELLRFMPHDTEDSDLSRRSLAWWRLQLQAELEGREAEVVEAIAANIEASVELLNATAIAESLRDAATYAVATPDAEVVLHAAERVDTLPTNARPRVIESQLCRLRANAAAAAGRHDEAGAAYAVALANARNLGFAYWLAPVLADYGGWLVATGHPDEAEPLLAEARELFDAMGASMWLERLDRIAPTARATA